MLCVFLSVLQVIQQSLSTLFAIAVLLSVIFVCLTECYFLWKMFHSVECFQQAESYYDCSLVHNPENESAYLNRAITKVHLFIC